MRPRSRRRTKTPPFQGTIRLAVVFALLIAVNVYFFFFRRGTSVKDLVALSENKQLAATVIAPAAPRDRKAPAAGKPGAPSPNDPNKQPVVLGEAESAAEDARIAAGAALDADTLGSILKRENVALRTAGEVSAALGRVFDLKTVRAGHQYTLRFDGEDRLRALEYRTSPATLYRVERTHSPAATAANAPASPPIKDTWRASRETAPIDVRVAAAGGTVEASLNDAVKGAGEGMQVVSDIVDLFAWDINFYVDSHPGDKFRILVEKQYLGEKFYRYGRVLAAEYSGKVGTFRAFRYEPADGSPAAYYDERGESVEKSMLKTPLKFVRISSAFDRRRLHPVSHTERAHLGVDYAAPVGTPVWATTAGKVAWKGPRGGAGECVIIAHTGGMETVYMHLSRYAKGLEVGQAVRQKQVIGYVGMTGLATGPHLHFSVKMGGHFVDPQRLKPARERPLSPAHKELFLAAVAPRVEELAKIDVRAVRREMARGPSPAP